jgi:hypothetical protein
MAPMGVYDQVKKAFQDIIAPELHTLHGEIQRVDANPRWTSGSAGPARTSDPDRRPGSES